MALGVRILASMAVLEGEGARVDVVTSALFDDNTAWIAVRRGRYLRGFAYRFIELCDPAALGSDGAVGNRRVDRYAL